MTATGLITTLLDAGYKRLFISNSDNLGAVPTARLAGWFAGSGSPFAIEAVRRTPSDRKGGHFAKRRSDGRIVLRETAQTLPEDREARADLDRHRFTSTNNIWIDLQELRTALDARDGIMGLPLIRNVKTVDPGDPSTPEVIQVESAMGAAIEIFEGATTIEVGRDRYIPVKTTNDLLVLRSDVYDIGPDFVLDQAAEMVPFVDLDGVYKLVGDFDKRFKAGAPSLRKATSLVVSGDWDFGSDVAVVGSATLDGERGRVESGSVIGD
jgi:UTP--glucose-1-phosphate uridylyltransferase